MTIFKNLEKARDLIRTHAIEANRNYNPYTYGIYVGMELLIAAIEGRNDLYYYKRPDKWLSDQPLDTSLPLQPPEITNEN